MNRMVITSREKLDQRIREEADRLAAERADRLSRELLMKQTDLAVLQSQINPHFLYNTLECIRGIALQSDQGEIADIAWSLSKYFRYGISGKSTIVTALSDELENVRNYVTIQQYRFRNRFTVSYDCETELENAPIPRLTLQPVVENAILHGFKNMTAGGEIRIRAERMNADVQITVSDNGCGMTPAELEALTDRILGIEQPGDGHHSGIGMHNVNARIRMRFGPQYGLTVYSCPGMGTDIRILIPGYPDEVEDET